MGYQRLRASFFVRPSGETFGRARPLKFTEKEVIWARDGQHCLICGQYVVPWGGGFSPFEDARGHIDHIIPRSRGGQNDPSNLRLLCYSCNSSKGAA